MSALPAIASGFLFSLSLIVAIGAQNAFVLRQGALRRHVGSVIAVCGASDVLLIALGVAGTGAVIISRPALLAAVRIIGSALLLTYAALAARRAMSGRSAGTAGLEAGSRRRAIATALGVTWLNPWAYLDTVVLVGSVAAAHPATRWWFGIGAATASVSWFLALGFSARLLAPALARPRGVRMLEAFIAIVMTVTALRTLPL